MTAMKLFTTVCAASMPLMKGADITPAKELQSKEFADIDVKQLSGVANDTWILHESGEQPQPVKVGSRVQISGFADDQKLNGSIGMVQGFDESKKQWIVLLDRDRGQLFDFGGGNQDERSFHVKADQVTVTTQQVKEGSRVQWWDKKKFQGIGSIYGVNKEQDKFTFIKDSDREKPLYYDITSAADFVLLEEQVKEGSRVQWWDEKELQGIGSIYAVNKKENKFVFIKDSDRTDPKYYDIYSAAWFVLLEEEFKVGSKVTNWFESKECKLTAGSTGVIQSCCKKTNQCLVKFDEESSWNIPKSYLVPVSE